MDGKLVILCDERPTIDEFGRWIGKDEDTHKRIINGIKIKSPHIFVTIFYEIFKYILKCRVLFYNI